MRKGIYLSCFIVIFIGIECLAERSEFPTDWSAWVKEVREEAIADGIRPEVFDKAFKGVKLNRRVQHFDRTQPETRLTFLKYRSSRIDAYRITLGRKEYRKHANVLEKVGADYGVNPCMITAIWGIESSYGRFKGDFPVIQSLATLAFEGRRTDFFRKELFIALHVLNGDHVRLEDFKGEWAGASGHSQFLPSSWQKYAVDYNKDGRRDIWGTLDDVFASIANYLKMNGWRADEPWVAEASLPLDFDESLFGFENSRTVSEWLQMGVKIKKNVPHDLKAAIIMPYGGPALMAFNNFKVIKRYNNSTFYAGSVGYLADRICAGI